MASRKQAIFQERQWNLEKAYVFRKKKKLNIMESHSLLIFQCIPKPRICLRQKYLSSTIFHYSNSVILHVCSYIYIN